MEEYPGTDTWIVKHTLTDQAINPPYHLISNDTDTQGDSDIHNQSDFTTSFDNLTEKGKGMSFGQILWIYAGPFIFVTGVVGNILVLAVMGRKRMQGTSTSVYLRLMAVADFSVLITGMIPEWLEMTDIVIFKRIHPATCKLEKFSFYTCADTAVWILMIFTVDRFIAVCFPLNKKEYCLPSRTKYYVLAAFLTAVTKNFHVFWTRGAEYEIQGNITKLYSNCGRPDGYKYFEKFVRPWIAFSLVSAVPFTIILICNTFIIRALLAVRRLRSEQSISSQSDRTLIQMTVMCLSASFSFLLCVAPSIIMLIGKPYWAHYDWYYMAKAINNQLVYVNHSINFFLYCLTGKRFRHELMHMCRCGKYRKFGSSSPKSSMVETTVYKVTNSKIASSPNPNRNARLQYPPKTGNGITKVNYNQLKPISNSANHRTNAFRPVVNLLLPDQSPDESPEKESAL